MRKAVETLLVVILIVPSATAADRGTVTTAPAGGRKLDLQAATARIVQLTNDFRKSGKLAPVRSNPALEKAARAFAGYLARTGKFSHTADGKEPSQRAAEAGYDYCIVAENLEFQEDSRGFTTEALATRLVAAWKRSPEHRRNMLDPDVTETGVAIAASPRPGRYYAVQMFGRPKSAQIRFSVANRTGRTVRYRIGKQDFALPSNYVGSHSICRPEDLALDGSSATGSRPAGGGGSLRPKEGGRYAIRDNGTDVIIAPEP